MAREILTVRQVAESLHVSTREVERMAEQRILPGVKVRDVWQFNSGEVWNWVEENLHILPERRRKDKHPATIGDLLIFPALKESGVVIGSAAKTKASVLHELAQLAETVDPYVHASDLAEDLLAREAQSSTALQYGVAIPHPGRPIYCEGPLIAAIHTVQEIAFGERDGGLSDLFFLVCCPTPSEHLLYLGRLCRLLIEADLREKLRDADTPTRFINEINNAEVKLCESK